MESFEEMVETVEAVETVPMFSEVDVQLISISSIIGDPGQARKYFDASEISSLAASLVEHGMIHPIHVRSVDDRYVVVSGERRFRAACEAGFQTVPCTVTTTENYTELSLVENFLRSDLTAIEKAEALHSLQMNGTSLSELSELVGLKENSISEIIGLTRLVDSIKDECRADASFAIRELKRIASADPEEQESLFTEYKKRREVDGKKKTRTVRDFETVVRCSKTLSAALGKMTLSADHERFNEISGLLDGLVSQILLSIKLNQLSAAASATQNSTVHEGESAGSVEE